MQFVVQIDYREPSYETRHGTPARPYHWRYRIEAPTEAIAVERALAEFRWIEALSSVGWTREVVDVIVEAVVPRADRSVARYTAP